MSKNIYVNIKLFVNIRVYSKLERRIKYVTYVGHHMITIFETGLRGLRGRTFLVEYIPCSGNNYV